MRSLPYATEHVLAMLSAAALSAMLVYAVATFDQSMKPSRASFAVSFVAFSVLVVVLPATHLGIRSSFNG